MAKLKIAIDNDIEFLVVTAEARAFGYSAEVQVKVKRARSGEVVSTLPAPDVFDLSPDQHEEVLADFGEGDDE